MQARRSDGIAEKEVRLGDCDLRYIRGGTGPTVVLLHTIRTQLEYFLALIRALGPGFDVVAPDLPGHGRSIALALAARKNPRVARIIAVNPYDHGRWGGIRRSSPLANVLFTAMLVPVVGEIVLKVGTTGVLRKVMEGGLYDSRYLPAELVDELWKCGSLPGHARAFLSPCRLWKTWIDACAAYSAIAMPVTLIYGDHDWSRVEDREANQRVLRNAGVSCSRNAVISPPSSNLSRLRG